MSRPTRHRSSPRARRLARESQTDLATVTGVRADGRVRAADVALAVRPRTGSPVPEPLSPPAAPAADPARLVAARALPSSCLLEADVTAVLGRATGGAADRTALLASVVGSVARAVSDLPRSGGPAGAVLVRVVHDDGREVAVDDAQLLSATGLADRLAATESSGPAAADAVVVVVGTALAGTTVEVRPCRDDAVAVVSVGPVVRRPVVVVGQDGEEQIGIRSVVWLALSTTSLAADDGSALLARVGADLSRVAVAR